MVVLVFREQVDGAHGRQAAVVVAEQALQAAVVWWWLW
jgi:hypothetical protein